MRARNLFSNIVADVRYAARTLVRQPVFTAVVVVTLALGIGVNTTVFSIYDQVLLRELPVASPHELVNLAAPGWPNQGNTSCNDGGSCDEIFSYPMFRDLERLDGPFTHIAAHRYVDANLSFDGSTVAGVGMLVSGSYFPLLGIRPAAGRLLDTSDDRVDGEAGAVVLSHAYWQSAFSGDSGVVGRDLVVNGKPLTIVGVAPRGFHGTTVGERPQVFLPITFRWLESPNALPNHADRMNRWAYLFARLKPGVSLEQATAAINGPYRAIVNDIEAPLITGFSERQLAEFRAKTLVLTPGARGQSRVDDNARTPLTILIVSTGLVLLIASVNVANLLLARGSTRVGEIAVRASLGASRPRLLTLLLTEIGLLAAGAALASAPLTLLALHGIRALLPASAVSAFDFDLDITVAATTTVLAVASTLVFGLIPALKLMRIEASPALRSDSTRATGGRTAARFRATLTTVQIALSMALIVLAGWFAQSMANVTRVDLGFRPDSLTVFSIAPERNGYEPPQSRELFGRLEEELAQIPGVTSVATAAVPLLASSNTAGNVSVEGYEPRPGERSNVYFNFVGADFFRTLEMPLVSGNGFDRNLDTDSPRVVIVNQRFVEMFGLGSTAVGKRIGLGQGNAVALDIEIAGVVQDAKYSEVKQDVPPQIFLPRGQGRAQSLGAMSFYLRSGLAPLALRAAVEQVLARHDRTLPLMAFRTVTEQAKDNVFLDRFLSTLAAALAAMATVLAGIGIYGVLSYGVVQRLREIGLRMALGATSSNVRGMVLRQVAWMAAVGVAAGVGLALLLGRVVRALLFGLTPTDPLVPVAAVLTLGAVVLAAAYWPARRASLVDPVTALRSE